MALNSAGGSPDRATPDNNIICLSRLSDPPASLAPVECVAGYRLSWPEELGAGKTANRTVRSQPRADASHRIDNRCWRKHTPQRIQDAKQLSSIDRQQPAANADAIIASLRTAGAITATHLQQPQRCVDATRSHPSHITRSNDHGRPEERPRLPARARGLRPAVEDHDGVPPSSSPSAATVTWSRRCLSCTIGLTMSKKRKQYWNVTCFDC